MAAFPAWLEQLVAESTGKQGRGIVPVADEPLLPPDGYGDDRLFLVYHLDDEPVPAGIDELEAAGHPVIRVAVDGAHEGRLAVSRLVAKGEAHLGLAGRSPLGPEHPHPTVGHRDGEGIEGARRGLDRDGVAAVARQREHSQYSSPSGGVTEITCRPAAASFIAVAKAF